MKIILNQMEKRSYKPPRVVLNAIYEHKMRSGPYEVPNPKTR
jgi:hypothetical protein